MTTCFVWWFTALHDDWRERMRATTFGGAIIVSRPRNV
jgi:hypothetical protein